MTMDTACGLLEAGLPFFEQPSSWVVDLSRVEQADSAGLAVLLEWLRRSRAAGGGMSLQAVPPGLASLADLYDLDAAFVRA